MQGSGHQRARGSGRLERAQVCPIAHAAAVNEAIAAHLDAAR